MSKAAIHQVTAFGKVFKYKVAELSTEIRTPDKTLTFTNWDVKGVRERFYREEYLDPEIHYNQPKEAEASEFGIKASDVRTFIEGNENIFDPLPPTPTEPVAVEVLPVVEPQPVEVEELSEAKGA